MTRQEAIEEITRRLVEYYHPDRIYLFGSEARGEAGPDSDLDFLVVVPDDTPKDFEGRAANVITSLPATVVREGRLLYNAERFAA